MFIRINEFLFFISLKKMLKRKKKIFSIINNAKEKININKNIERKDKKYLVNDETNGNKANNNKTYKYIKKIKEDHQFTGYLEINKIAQLLNIIILCHTLNDDKYEL